MNIIFRANIRGLSRGRRFPIARRSVCFWNQVMTCGKLTRPFVPKLWWGFHYALLPFSRNELAARFPGCITRLGSQPVADDNDGDDSDGDDGDKERG